MLELPIWNSSQKMTIAPSKIIALGLNYLDHIKESENIALKLAISADRAKNEIPTEPLLFPKTPNVLIGPDEAIILPKIAYTYDFSEVRTDIEAELALIIRDRCRNVSQEETFKHILGYTAMNDISQRNIQKSDKCGWFRGKSFDTFGPIGPLVVLHEDLLTLGDPQNLWIESRINGKLKQHSNTKHMIFSIPEIIAFVSRNFTLEAGDIILTGTPQGVSPIQPGDSVEVEIEHIGILRNSVEMEQ
ncbi:MAG: FAA hydrolase family protein [Promethearchaeota archaeon]|nr:MAG: FAA hydrolase family protein [Candidatus Lokiarchaeota archaeon]